MYTAPHAVSDRKREPAVRKGQKASETAPWRLPTINTHDAFGGASGVGMRVGLAQSVKGRTGRTGIVYEY